MKSPIFIPIHAPSPTKSLTWAGEGRGEVGKQFISVTSQLE
jgi:hypothetical protein